MLMEAVAPVVDNGTTVSTVTVLTLERWEALILIIEFAVELVARMVLTMSVSTLLKTFAWKSRDVPMPLWIPRA